MPKKSLISLALGFLTKRSKPRTRTRRSAESDPELSSLWASLQARFFEERPDILSYKIRWSGRRQKRVLASCSLRQREVRVAKELSEPECGEWLEPVLYHEMCHAILGHTIADAGGRRRWHGREFKSLVYRHPQTMALDHWMHSGGWSTAVRRSRARGRFR